MQKKLCELLKMISSHNIRHVSMNALIKYLCNVQIYLWCITKNNIVSNCLKLFIPFYSSFFFKSFCGHLLKNYNLMSNIILNYIPVIAQSTQNHATSNICCPPFIQFSIYFSSPGKSRSCTWRSKESVWDGQQISLLSLHCSSGCTSLPLS